MQSLRHFLKNGGKASDAIKSLKFDLKCLEQQDAAKDENQKLLEKISADFDLLVEAGLQSEKNKQKIVRKFLSMKTGEQDFKDTLIFRIVRNAHRFPGHAQLHMKQLVSFTVQNHKLCEFNENKGLRLLADTLIEMYCQHDVAPAFATNLADILKDMMKTQFLLHHILGHAQEKLLPTCFARCKDPCFVKSTDAFFFLEHMLLLVPNIGSAWLQRNFDSFFQSYMTLLDCEQYTTKRQSIRLLCDILEKREFKPVMYKFVSCKARLKQTLRMIVDTNPSISVEAFHVFKLFLGNPRKSPEVYKTLFQNKSRLISFLQGFRKHSVDGHMWNEKHALLQVLDSMVETPDVYTKRLEALVYRKSQTTAI